MNLFHGTQLLHGIRNIFQYTQRQRRHLHRDRIRPVVPFPGFRPFHPVIHDPCAAILCIVGIKNLLILSRQRRSGGDLPFHTGKIRHDQKHFIRISPLSQIGQVAVLGRDMVHPLKPFRHIIQLV